MKSITCKELKLKLDNGEQIHLIDVREPDEHNAYNAGGLLIPLGKIQTMQVDEIEDWKDDEIVLYCRSGNRSMQAALILETMGFSNVKNLTGGMQAWLEFNKQQS